MKVFVTGGAGYIGSHLVKKLIQADYSVLVYDNLSTGFKSALHADIEFIEGDIRDAFLLKKTFSNFRPDAVIHLAAKLSVPESIIRPLEYYDNNVNGLIVLLKVCAEFSMQNFIFSSTAAVYGNSSKLGLYSEESTLAPLNPYGFSKMFAEQILRDCESVFGVKSIILRYFNVSGAAMDGSNGQRTRNSSQLIKRAAEVACGLRESISIYGNNYSTHDGTCIRDYIHVEDLAQIHLEALRYLSSHRETKSEVINCGYGLGSSVNEIINMMKKVSGIDFGVKLEPRRKGDAEITVSEINKLKLFFKNWIPQYADLETICQTAYQWELKQKQQKGISGE